MCRRRNRSRCSICTWRRWRRWRCSAACLACLTAHGLCINHRPFANHFGFDPAQLATAEIEPFIGAFEQRSFTLDRFHVGHLVFVPVHFPDQPTVLRWKNSTANSTMHSDAKPAPASTKRPSRLRRCERSSLVNISVTDPTTGRPLARANRAEVG